MTLTERFMSLPRAIRWLLVAVGFVVAFQAWDLTLGTVSRGWSDDADRIERSVQEVVDVEAIQSRMDDLEDAIVAIGPVELPRRDAAGREALNRAIGEVIGNDEYGITDDEFSLGSGNKIPRSLSTGLLPSGRDVSRLTGELEFTASPEDAIAIIADLESRPEIDAISEVSMKKESNRKVGVTLTMETWIEAPEKRRR